MTKKCYTSVNNVSKRAKYIYVSVNGKAKKVKKGYISVGGKAKLFYVCGYEVTLGKHDNCSIKLSYTYNNVTVTKTDENLYDVPEGVTIKIDVTPDAGYSVASVTPAGGSFVVGSDTTITATTTQNTYTVKLGEHTGSKVTITADRATANGIKTITDGDLTGVYYGTSIKVTATGLTDYDINSINID